MDRAIKNPVGCRLTGSFRAEGSVNYLRRVKVVLQTKKVIGNRPGSRYELALILNIHLEYRLHTIAFSTFRLNRKFDSTNFEREGKRRGRLRNIES